MIILNKMEITGLTLSGSLKNTSLAETQFNWISWQVTGQKNSVDEILCCSAWPEVDTAPQSTAAQQDPGRLLLSHQSDGQRTKETPKVKCRRNQFKESLTLIAEWNGRCWRIRNNCHYCCQYWYRPSYTQPGSHSQILTTHVISNNNNQTKHKL